MMNLPKNESGYVLVGVLLIFTIVAVLGLSIVMSSLTSVKTSHSERDNQSAYYIAEAGLTYYMKEIKEKVQNIYERDNVKVEENFYNNLGEIKRLENDGIYEGFEEENEIQPKATVKVVGKGNNQFQISSIGEIGETRRKVESTFTVEWKEKFENKPYQLPDKAVFVKETITLKNSGSIDGNIGTLKEGVPSIFAEGNPSIGGDIRVKEGYEEHAVDTEVLNFPKAKGIKMGSIPELPSFPSFPLKHQCPKDKIIINQHNNEHSVIKNCNLNINNHVVKSANYKLNLNSGEKLYFKSLNIEQDLTLFIDVGDSDKEIVVSYLNLKGGNIVLLGKGRLTFYVEDKITTGYGNINSEENINNLNIFYKGQESVFWGSNTKIYGSLFVETADITGGNGGGFYGNIFTGGTNLDIKGNADSMSQLILAPNADVTIDNSGRVNGMIVSKNLLIKGNGKVIYDESLSEDIDGPISPSGLGHESEGSGIGGSEGKLTDASPSITTSPIREVSE